MRRKPNSNPEIFKLGHWERMVIGLALTEYANQISGDLPEEREHVEALARVFSVNDVNISIVREWEND